MAHQNPLFLFFLVFLLSLTFFCFPSSASLSTVAVSQTSNDTIACALIPGDVNAISCYNYRQNQSFHLLPSVGFRAVAGGGGFVCALRISNSALICWDLRSSPARPRRVARGQLGIAALQVGWRGQVCALDSAENLSCWRWSGVNFTSPPPRLSSIAVGDQFLCGRRNGSNAVECYVTGLGGGWRSRDPPMLLVAAGMRHACGLVASTGKVECWSPVSSGTVYSVPDHTAYEFNQLALGDNWSCALRASNRTVACWRADGSRLLTPLDQVELLHLSAEGSVLCGVVSGNYSLICWNATEGRPGPQTSLALSYVLPGPCVSTCQSQVLPGSGNLCPAGWVICAPNDFLPNISTSPPPSIQSPPPPSPPAHRISRRNLAFVIVGSVGTAIGVASLACFLVTRFCGGMTCRVHDSGPIEQMPPAPGSQPSQASPPKSRPPQLGRLVSLGVGAKLEEFPLEMLVKVTNNFCASSRTGTGSFGSVYEAYLPDGRHVAIKRAEAPSPSSVYVRHYHQDNEHAFEAELAFLSRLNHKNLVQLIGFCEEETAELERVLVYEFMTNGSLHDHLHKRDDSRLHDWVFRIRVALDAARGIEYLHTYAVPPIIHRDIKSANILLDATWTAKVADFGLSLMGPADESGHLSLRAAGTVGYMDPEYYRLQQLTTKSDVYSFGVVLLELLTGYKAIHKVPDGSSPRNVVDFAVPFIVSDEIHQVLDRRLSPPTPYEIEAVTYVGYLAADCVSLEGKDRPSMTEVVSSLERALAACMRTPSGSRSQSFD
ncbi:serine/threonine-protein kinase-like protein CCR4 [Nymphaea colorata]|nr:serine/threonine-protein kinase-like protein CCR4 [Nymphaea colorata]